MGIGKYFTDPIGVGRIAQIRYLRSGGPGDSRMASAVFGGGGGAFWLFYLIRLSLRRPLIVDFALLVIENM